MKCETLELEGSGSGVMFRMVPS